jgi:phosphoribosyl-ATP pyrophosphohydrolase
MQPIHSKNKKVGYHVVSIPKGSLGLSDKILEEVLELIDAEKQSCKIMALLELSDLVGAIQAYLEKNHPDFLLKDLEIMSSITRRVFKNGHRT